MSEFDWSALRQSADDATRPLPIGDYVVTVTKSEVKVASTGAPMIAVQLGVNGGPSAGRTLFTNFVLSPDKPFALKMWFDNLGAFGLDNAFFNRQPAPTLEEIAGTLVGRLAVTNVAIRVWQGQERNECKTFRVPTAMERAAAGGSPSGPIGGIGVPIPGNVPPVPGLAATPPTVPSTPPVPPVPPSGGVITTGNSTTPPQPPAF